MQTFSVGKMMQEHNKVQKITGEKSTNTKEQGGRFVPPRQFVLPFYLSN